uniref:SFRICE_024778 n=1 Tax=Spodoptera frugiperda TaxID=7108 RepID=A0A2H1VRR2_SPOFR
MKHNTSVVSRRFSVRPCCYSNPCRNGGSCRARGAGGHECLCARGYHGDECQHQIDACYGSPCAHGMGWAYCHILDTIPDSVLLLRNFLKFEKRPVVLFYVKPVNEQTYHLIGCCWGIGDWEDWKGGNRASDNLTHTTRALFHVGFLCSCQAGYTGARCEVNIDDCVANKCQNNATCVDHLEGYSCKCAPGFMGEFCEKKIPYCTKEFNPCENGAVCTDHHSHYTCACPKGYSGQNCTVNADDCINHMCQDDIILERPLLSTANDYLCKCAPGYSGRLCEYLTSLTFSHNDSLVELEPLRTTPQANVTLMPLTLYMQTLHGNLHIVMTRQLHLMDRTPHRLTALLMRWLGGRLPRNV